MSPGSILLVEDDKDDQEFFMEALAEMDSSVLCDVVNNGKEAIEALKQSLQLPSFIFMDINMPLMNGIECLSELKKDPRTKNIPVVMLTSMYSQTKRAILLGAASFIVKADDFVAFQQQLAEVLA